MRNGIVTTVAGWVATDPREIVDGGSVWTSFRLGVTPRRRDAVTQAWTDGRTEWVTVKVWREVARNVVESISKGQPVVVHGRLEVDEWTTPEGTVRRDLALHAWNLGHDLTHGRSTFVRRVHVRPDDDAEQPGTVRSGARPDGTVEPDAWTSDGADARLGAGPEPDEPAVPEPSGVVG